MMRNFAVALVASTFLFAGTASANYTIDLIWSDSGTKTLTVVQGDSAAPIGSSGDCAAGALFTGTGGGQGRCLEVRLTAAVGWTAATTTIGWHAGTSGLALQHVGALAFGAGNIPGAGAVTPNPAGAGDCGVACDTARGSFGALSLSVIAAGAYALGSINFDTSGTLVGSHTITAFSRVGVDGVTDKFFNNAAFQLNGAILNVTPIPEPGTAALLGLGIMGLVAAGRRRKA